MSKIVLVVAAHPDDEVLGCGGAIAWHVLQGDEVHLLVLADGESARQTSTPWHVSKRRECTAAAAAILGIRSLTQLGLPDNRLDSIPLLDVVIAIEQVLTKLLPEVVYTHFHGDLNVDHRITCEATLTACRPIPGSTVHELLCFEVVSSSEWSAAGTDFRPTVFVDITNHLDCKVLALSAYSEEMRDPPHSRSLEHVVALAKHRGHCSGVHAAEGFVLIRSIRR